MPGSPTSACSNPHAPAAERLPELRELKVPKLVLLGERDVYPIKKVATVLEKDADIPVVRIPGAGHMVNMEKPAEFNRAVLDFLKAARP